MFRKVLVAECDHCGQQLGFCVECGLGAQFESKAEAWKFSYDHTVGWEYREDQVLCRRCSQVTRNVITGAGEGGHRDP